MALVDVTSVLTDPDFTDTFTVIRRKETIDTTGYSTVSLTTFNNVIGVVYTASSTKDIFYGIERTQNYEVNAKGIIVITKFALQTEVIGYQPDLVVWRGSNYFVKRSDPYVQFDSGFYRAMCNLIDLVAPPETRYNANTLSRTLGALLPCL